MTPLLAKLKEEETRKELLVLELDSFVKHGNVTELDEARLKRDLRQRVVVSPTGDSDSTPQSLTGNHFTGNCSG